MAVLNLNRRRTTTTRLADHAESCEVRVLLSGVAIYPAPAVTKPTVSGLTDTQSNVVVLTPADYNGSWDIGGASILQLVVKGSDPETAKVKGKINAAFLAGGSAKFKGKITNGIHLEGSAKGKIISGLVTGKVKSDLSVDLTDSTHFAGIATATPKGLPPTTGSVMGVKL
ncbi:MAG: hypothetical protein KDA65_17140 [Planctomycetaceae bacterium]|nr:hypothetical protein [Planctomycetaceae bacterium]